MNYVFDPAPPITVPVVGGGRFPVRRIFCIGRNFDEHVREMGGDPKADPPVFFTKPADAVVAGGTTVASGATVPYPPATSELHFEGELVLALGGEGNGLRSTREAESLIYGYACGCDLTRRDLQRAARAGGGPWDTAKGFDRSAPVGAIQPRDAAPGVLDDARLQVLVNGDERQSAALDEMIWTPAEVVVKLSQLFSLARGDLVFTGTPAGVGPLEPGDTVQVAIDTLPALAFTIG